MERGYFRDRQARWPHSTPLLLPESMLEPPSHGDVSHGMCDTAQLQEHLGSAGSAARCKEDGLKGTQCRSPGSTSAGWATHKFACWQSRGGLVVIVHLSTRITKDFWSCEPAIPLQHSKRPRTPNLSKICSSDCFLRVPVKGTEICQ